MIRVLRHYLRDRWKDTSVLFPSRSSSRLTTDALRNVAEGLDIAVLWYIRNRYRGTSGVSGLFGRALSSNVVFGSLVVAMVGVGAAVGGVSLSPSAGLFLQ